MKAEKEAAAKQEAERVIRAGTASAACSKSQAPAAPAMETVEDPVHVLDFRVHATKSQLDKLKRFLTENNIKYGPVPKEGQ